MNASLTLLDKYKTMRGITSDNACAQDLGITRATVSRWRTELGHPEADLVEKMCAVTGEKLAHWLPLIEAERARSPAARKAWLRLAQAAAAVVMMVSVSAHTADGGPSRIRTCNQGIMRPKGRRWARAGCSAKLGHFFRSTWLCMVERHMALPAP